MIPAALCSQLERGIADFLRMSFWSSTPGMAGVIDQLVATPGGILKGPYVSVKLPFEQGGADEFFPKVPLGFPAHRHQEQAFQRLSGPSPRSTIVATGTGSGKTEAFLWPILEHCRQQVGTPGIKAILIYPMNALATDQAKRIAEAIHANPSLRGAVTAGLYIGESPGERRKTQKDMGPDSLITDRKKLQLSPPDILLTNYKMLDYLLIRPHDQQLWQHNRGDALRFLVVDELHTFDGPQGTDLACLVRRLKARLKVEPGSLCCIGTSATLGGSSAPDVLRAYAAEIFGEPFDEGAVITEQRQTAAEFFANHLIAFADVAPLDDPGALDPSLHASPLDYVAAQQALWFDEPIDAAKGTEDWRLKLGDQLLGHGMLRNLVTLLGGGPRELDELLAGITRVDRRLRGKPELARWVVLSFLALVSEARARQVERDEVAARREAAGEPPPTRPFLEVRIQLWQREMARMVASVEPKPVLRFSDDLTAAQFSRHLPLIHCRECGAMGWATLQHRDRASEFHTSLPRFYRAFFSDDPQVKFLWPEAAAPKSREWAAAPRIALERGSLVRARDDDELDEDEVIRVVASANVESHHGVQELHRNCPFCAARGSLTLVGFRAATLTSVYIDQLFASSYNDDKKLLTFSDSVQDAAHRAGFFGARTWRFNLRVALQQVVRDHEGVSLEALPAIFSQHWRAASRRGDTGYVSTFLAPNMEWFEDYEKLLKTGDPPVARLMRDVERRVAFEIFSEYSLQARIGRSLARTGCSTAFVDPGGLEQAIAILLEPLRNEIGGLRDLDEARLRRFIIGILHHVRERGGLHHPELPVSFIETGGRDTYVFKRQHHLPVFGRTSRMPALLTNDAHSPQFDAILLKSSESWYERWTSRCLAGLAPLITPSSDIWPMVLTGLTEAGLFIRTEGKHGAVWGVRPGALRVSSELERLRCDTCHHWMVVARVEREDWAKLPCLTARCEGSYQTDDSPLMGYFGQLYSRGEVERVFTAEHTGLLTRVIREEVETQFKTEQEARLPWYPNLLSCTPTLEMGIDIGALSSAILCSVPPAQANYLQRIGRAGRRDGNSLLLTVAQAKPHDLYFYAQPEEMLTGDVSPPGVFLNASAVLERQLAAYCLDCWNAEGADERSIPDHLGKVFDQLDGGNSGRFPHNWIEFIKARQERLLREFISLFEGRLNSTTTDHLREFLIGGRGDKGSLSHKLLELLHEERKQRDSLREQSKKLKAIIDELLKTQARDKDHDDNVREHRRERDALASLVTQLDDTNVLLFLTDQGLLPNYAFPESPIRLRSVIWRKKRQLGEGETGPEEPKSDGSRRSSPFETKSYEYTRPAISAISELAPENKFFAGGRNVAIDQVDVATAQVEWWRFCDCCSYSVNIDTGDLVKDCPRCHSQVWGEEDQKRQLLRLHQVFANTSDRDSRIGDDHDERQPKHYNKRMLMSFEDKDRGRAWTIKVPAVPFGFEYLRRANFRDVNFGEFSDDGTKFSIGGREEVRKGFLICRHCGKTQKRPPQGSTKPPPEPEHALWCPARKRGSERSDFKTAVYLYREFFSEALRLLLPLSTLGSEKQLNSFLAAFQLGLRDKYRGRVDHLHTLVYDEPESGGQLRRQYLVLYDTVPGGTGYLKDFTHKPPDADRHPIFDILQRALTRMKTCVCVADPEKDGCYRCLFAYRSSHDMSDTSRIEAIKLFERIIEHEGQLVEVDALASVSVSGMLGSVLEARFIEVLRQLDTPARPIQLDKDIVHNQPGWRLKVGDQVWKIEPQHNVGPSQGIDPYVSIDFVFHPGATKSNRLPVAVFLDGYQFHRDRLGKDLLQRMTLLTSGRYDVWHFTWYDIERGFRRDVKDGAFLLHSSAKALQEAASRSQRHKPFVDCYTKPLLELFVDSLAAERDPTPWADLATIALITQMQRPGAVDPASWVEQIAERVPAEVARWFEDADPSLVYVARPPAERGCFGLWANAPTAAVRDASQTAAYKVLVWLDDSDQERATTNEFCELWRGVLHAFMFLRRLPNAWFITAHGQSRLDFRPLALKRDVPGDAAPHGWAALGIEPEFADLARRLQEAAQRVELPEVGIDLLDARGHTCGLIGELVWHQARVAVVESRDDAETPVDPAWSVFDLESLRSDVEPLLTALRNAGKGC